MMETVFVIQIQTGEYSDLMTEIDGVYASQELANIRIQQIYDAHCKRTHPKTMKCPGYSPPPERTECPFIAYSEPFDIITVNDIVRPMSDHVTGNY